LVQRGRGEGLREEGGTKRSEKKLIFWEGSLLQSEVGDICLGLRRSEREASGGSLNMRDIGGIQLGREKVGIEGGRARDFKRGGTDLH